jgi:hypothetical protein
VDEDVHADMLMWALDRAVGGQWRFPSINDCNGVTTRDDAERLLHLEQERGYTKPVEEKAGLSASSCCREEGIVGDKYCWQTRVVVQPSRV